MGFLKIGGSLGAAIGRGLLQIGAPPRPGPDVEHPPRRAQMAPTAQRSIWSTLLPGARKSGAPPDAAAALTTMLPPPLASCSSWLRTGDIQARPAAGHIPQMAMPVPGPLTDDAGTVQWDITLEDFQHLSIIWIQDM